MPTGCHSWSSPRSAVLTDWSTLSWPLLEQFPLWVRQGEQGAPHVLVVEGDAGRTGQLRAPPLAGGRSRRSACWHGCRGSAFLATSREPLGVCGRAGQCIWHHCAHRGETTWETSLASPAVELFCLRAMEAGAPIVLQVDNAATVAAICRRLDGIPLALELAAARARSMPLAELERRLDDTFRLLVGTGRGAVERHQTLRRTVEWSYSLLTDHRAGRLRAGLGFPRWLQPRVGRGRGGDHRTGTGPLTDPRLPTRSEPWSTSRWCSWTATAAATASSKRSACSRPNIWRWRARPTGPARPTRAGVCSSSRTAPARPSAMISIGYSRRPQRAATWDRRQCGRRQHGTSIWPPSCSRPCTWTDPVLTTSHSAR